MLYHIYSNMQCHSSHYFLYYALFGNFEHRKFNSSMGYAYPIALFLVMHWVSGCII